MNFDFIIFYISFSTTKDNSAGEEKKSDRRQREREQTSDRVRHKEKEITQLIPTV